MEQEILNKLAQDFIYRLKLPSEKAGRPFIVATIGSVGSGRTTIARRIVDQIDGSVLVQANSARFLLKEAGLPWGENVRQILKQVSKELLAKGYGVVFDGNASDEEDRKNISEIAAESGAKIFYLRINIDPEIVKGRERKKYDNPNWISNFEDFRVNTTDKMLKNIDERTELHKNLKSNEIPNLVGEIDNNGTLDNLNRQTYEVIEKIKQQL